VRALRDSFADVQSADPKKRTNPEEDYNRPAAASNLLRALSAVMTWAVPHGRSLSIHASA
jgi:hypothetical protein